MSDQSDSRTLINAVQSKDVSNVRRLIDVGADLEATDERGWTPLLAAAYEGYAEIVSVLIEAGANVGARTPDGQTPLMNAAFNGSLGAVTAILDGGAEIDAKDNHGWTPLMFVTIYRHGKRAEPLATCLLDRGAEVDATNDAGWNAGMMATKNGMPDLVQLFLRRRGTAHSPAKEMAAGVLLDMGVDAALNPEKYGLEDRDSLRERPKEPVFQPDQHRSDLHQWERAGKLRRWLWSSPVETWRCTRCGSLLHQRVGGDRPAASGGCHGR